MKIYNYDPATGAFLNESDAFSSPLEEGVFLVPAHATDIAPPACNTHEVAVFADGAWVAKADYRNVTLYDTQTGKEASISEVGVTPADKGLTDVKPLDTPCKWDAASNTWVDDLDAIRKKKSNDLNMACHQAISAGVTSSALGAPYTYPTQITDQHNLAANVMMSLVPNLPADWTTQQVCADSNNVWDYRPHTAAQIQQVGNDVKAAILLLRMKNSALQARVQDATSADAINAIAW